MQIFSQTWLFVYNSNFDDIRIKYIQTFHPSFQILQQDFVTQQSISSQLAQPLHYVTPIIKF